MKNRIYYGEYSLKYWIEMLLKKKITLPEYQRSFVWSDNALNIDDEEKKQQEINSLCRINDSFKKFVVIKDNIEPWQDDKGIQYIGIEQFLLEEDWLR